MNARANPLAMECGLDRDPIHVRPVANTDAEAWDAFVLAHPDASIYHLWLWRGVVERVFHQETHYLVACCQDGMIKGVLPLVRLRSRLFGHYLVSLPYFNYGGALGTPEAEAMLMAEANLHATALGCSHVEYRDRCPRLGYGTREEKVSMRLDLPPEVDTLWRQLASKRRAQIRRPRREGVAVRWGGTDLVNDFYRVFAQNMRDLGTPVYAKALFSHITRSAGTNCRIVVVNIGGRPVAGAFLLGFRDTLEIPWASSLRAVNGIGVNMLLYWEVMRCAIEMGYSRFDFGRCTRGSGTWRFKRQWGAVEHPLYWSYYLVSGDRIPQLTPSNPKYRLAIALWRRLPVAATKWLGPPLVRNLP